MISNLEFPLNDTKKLIITPYRRVIFKTDIFQL